MSAIRELIAAERELHAKNVEAEDARHAARMKELTHALVEEEKQEAAKAVAAARAPAETTPLKVPPKKAGAGPGKAKGVKKIVAKEAAGGPVVVKGTPAVLKKVAPPAGAEKAAVKSSPAVVPASPKPPTPHAAPQPSPVPLKKLAKKASIPALDAAPKKVATPAAAAKAPKKTAVGVVPPPAAAAASAGVASPAKAKSVGKIASKFLGGASAETPAPAAASPKKAAPKKLASATFLKKEPEAAAAAVAAPAKKPTVGKIRENRMSLQFDPSMLLPGAKRPKAPEFAPTPAGAEASLNEEGSLEISNPHQTLADEGMQGAKKKASLRRPGARPKSMFVPKSVSFEDESAFSGGGEEGAEEEAVAGGGEEEEEAAPAEAEPVVEEAAPVVVAVKASPAVVAKKDSLPFSEPEASKNKVPPVPIKAAPISGGLWGDEDDDGDKKPAASNVTVTGDFGSIFSEPPAQKTQAPAAKKANEDLFSNADFAQKTTVPTSTVDFFKF